MSVALEVEIYIGDFEATRPLLGTARLLLQFEANAVDLSEACLPHIVDALVDIKDVDTARLIVIICALRFIAIELALHLIQVAYFWQSEIV